MDQYRVKMDKRKDTTLSKPLKIRVIRVIRDNPRFRQKHTDTAPPGLMIPEYTITKIRAIHIIYVNRLLIADR